MRFRPRALDYVAILIGIAVLASVTAAAYRRPARNKELHITTATGNWIYPISEDRTFEVEGPLGATSISISDEEVRILDSPCPQKLCIQKGSIKAVGHWNACLPNRVFLSIEGPGSADEGSVDAHSH
jgi:hypothetical protein